MIENIKRFLKINNLDGYIIPKNDNYFTEYSKINNLARVTNFTGSAGFAIILKNTNYLFVDGRYTLQAKKQSGKNFKILEIPYIYPKDLSNMHNSKIGFNPKLFTPINKYLFNVAKYNSANPELLIKRAIIAANNKTKPLAASSLKNHLNGLDK